LIAKFGSLDIVNGWSNVMDAVTSANLLMSTVNTTAETQQGNLADILTNLRDTSSALRDFSYQIRDNPSLLLRSSDAPPLPETK